MGGARQMGPSTVEVGGPEGLAPPGLPPDPRSGGRCPRREPVDAPFPASVYPGRPVRPAAFRQPGRNRRSPSRPLGSNASFLLRERPGPALLLIPEVSVPERLSARAGCGASIQVNPGGPAALLYPGSSGECRVPLAGPGLHAGATDRSAH
jgi:hypothetical protein